MGNQKIYKPDPKSRTAGHRKLKIGRKASLSRQTSTDLDTIYITSEMTLKHSNSFSADSTVGSAGDAFLSAGKPSRTACFIHLAVDDFCHLHTL